MIRRHFLLAAPSVALTKGMAMATTDQNEAVLAKALDRLGEVSAALVREECKSPEDALAVATALCMKAESIFVATGGKRNAAAQFYAFADRNTQ